MSKIVSKIINLYETYGDNKYGEYITQVEHAVQCAALASNANSTPELTVATLLHDIGHLLEAADKDHGNFKHDEVGTCFLSQYFDLQVSEPVRLHAQAKRYLCAINAHYYEKLSNASRFSLEKQGGLMTAGEIRHFESNPYFNDAVQLRRWDDDGKNDLLKLDSFSTYRDMILSVLR